MKYSYSFLFSNIVTQKNVCRLFIDKCLLNKKQKVKITKVAPFLLIIHVC